MNEGVHLLDLLLFNKLQRIEIADFARETNRKRRYIETRDRGYCTSSGEQRRPHLFLGVSCSANQTHTSDYYTTSQIPYLQDQKLTGRDTILSVCRCNRLRHARSESFRRPHPGFRY